MNLDIAYYIRQVLRENNEAFLPGIGRFFVSMNSAKISTDKKSISPPSYDLRFEEVDSNQEKKLLEYIKDDTNLDETTIHEHIQALVEKIYSRLINLGTFYLDGIGTLEKNEGQSKIDFFPDKDNFSKRLEALPIVDISPVKRVEEKITQQATIEAPDTLIKTVEEENETIFSWWIPIIAGCIFGLLYISWMKGCFDRKSNNEDIMIGSKINNPNQNNEEEIKESSGKDLAINQKDNEEVVNAEKSITQIPDAIEASESETLGNETQESTSEGKSPKTITTPVPSKKCTIVVGVFRNPRNVTRMVSKLERNGYHAVTVQHNGLTRVGHDFDGNGVDLKEYIYTVREQIDPKAWYLDPALRVEYR